MIAEKLKLFFSFFVAFVHHLACSCEQVKASRLSMLWLHHCQAMVSRQLPSTKALPLFQ